DGLLKDHFLCEGEAGSLVLIDAAAQPFGNLKIWNSASWQDLVTPKGHAERITSIAYSPDGSQLVSASADKTLKIWNATSGQELRTLTGHAERIDQVTFSPDGAHIASVSGFKTIKTWNVATGDEVREMRGNITRLAFAPDGKQLVTVGVDGSIRL